MMRLRARLSSIFRRTPFHPQWLVPASGASKFLPELRGLVLDVGCADKWVRSRLPDDACYVGIDYPATGALLYDARPEIFADAAVLPLQDRSVDAVVCLEVLEHVREPQKALREFQRVLKPGGQLLVSVPFLYPVHDAPHDFQRFTRHGLDRDLEEAGFLSPDIRETGHAVRAAALLLSLSLVGGYHEQRRWWHYAVVPLALVAVCIVNILAVVASALVPNWPALSSGYLVVAAKGGQPLRESSR